MEFHSAVGTEAKARGAQKKKINKKEMGPKTCDRGLDGITASRFI